MKIGSKVKVVTLIGSKQVVIKGLRDTIGRQGVIIVDNDDFQLCLVKFDNGDTFWYFHGELEEVKEEVK